MIVKPADGHRDRQREKSAHGDVVLTVVTSVFALVAIAAALLGLRFLLTQ